jgi:non-heme chloroperoxidase
MPYITVGTEKNADIKVSYADYGEGKPVILIHGWPLSHRMWEKQIGALVDGGYRVIAYDRRGFGESYKPWNGFDYDTLAGDLATIIDSLGLDDVSLVGFSMGGGEVARYIGTHGTAKIAKAVLIGSITPYLKKTDDNPDGADQAIFQGMLDGLAGDRPEFLYKFCKNFVNWDSDGKELLSQAALNHSWDIAVWANPKATFECLKSVSNTDFREDLKKFDVPTLVIHGDADAIIPFEISGKRVHDMLPDSELLLIEGGAHGLTYTQPDKVNAALLDFLGK